MIVHLCFPVTIGGGTVGSGNGLKLDSSGNLTVTADVTVGDDLTVEGGVVDVKTQVHNHKLDFTVSHQTLTMRLFKHQHTLIFLVIQH